LDSITLNDSVLTHINQTYLRSFVGADPFHSVSDLIKAATGELQESSDIDFKPASELWKARLREQPVTLAPGATIMDSFLNAAGTNPDQLIASDDVIGEVSYRKLLTMVSMLTTHFEQMPGDRVGLLLPNAVVGTACTLACLFAGKTPVFMNPEWNDAQATHAMKAAGVERIVTAQKIIRKLRAAKDRTDEALVREGKKTIEEVAEDPHQTIFPSIDKKLFPVDNITRRLNDIQGVLELKMSSAALSKLGSRNMLRHSSDEACILFTSGSTGNPKPRADVPRASFAERQGFGRSTAAQTK